MKAFYKENYMTAGLVPSSFSIIPSSLLQLSLHKEMCTLFLLYFHRILYQLKLCHITWSFHLVANPSQTLSILGKRQHSLRFSGWLHSSCVFLSVQNILQKPSRGNWQNLKFQAFFICDINSNSLRANPIWPSQDWRREKNRLSISHPKLL